MGATKSFRRYIQGKDKFGYPIALNWNGGGSTFNTTLGGLVSMVIMTIKIIFFLLKFQQLIMKTHPLIGYDKELQDFEEIGQIDFDQTEFIPYIQITDRIPFHDLHKYYTIEFENYVWNPDADETKGERKEYRDIVHARPCIASDFPGHEELVERDGRKGVQKICMHDRTGMQLAGTKENWSRAIKTFQINIWQCKDKVDEDGNKITGIVDGSTRKYPGIENDPTLRTEDINCAPDEEIRQHLVDHGFMEINYISQKLNMKMFGRKPVFSQNQFFGGYKLFQDRSYYTRSTLQQNSIATQDDWIQVGQAEHYSYWDVDGKIDMIGKKDIDERTGRQRLMEIEFVISDTKVDHTRKSFGVFDLMGVIGGFERNLSLIGLFFLKPIAHHNYLLKAIQKLYMAKTTNDRVFVKRKNKKIVKKEKLALKMSQGLSPAERVEVLSDRHIKYSSKQHILLYFQMMFPYVPCFKQRELWKLRTKGAANLKKELNVVKIIKSLRDMKILFKSKLLDEDTKFQIQHSNKNIIKIDPGSTESSDGDQGPEEKPPKVKQDPLASVPSAKQNKLHPAQAEPTPQKDENNSRLSRRQPQQAGVPPKEVMLRQNIKKSKTSDIQMNQDQENEDLYDQSPIQGGEQMRRSKLSNNMGKPPRDKGMSYSSTQGLLPPIHQKRELEMTQNISHTQNMQQAEEEESDFYDNQRNDYQDESQIESSNMYNSGRHDGYNAASNDYRNRSHRDQFSLKSKQLEEKFNKWNK